MDAFVFESLPGRVVFGSGALDQLPQEIERLGARRALVLSTPEQRPCQRHRRRASANEARESFRGGHACARSKVARQARAEAAGSGPTAWSAMGGGSTIGLGKAIALESSLPILAIPTTYAGSEMTPI